MAIKLDVDDWNKRSKELAPSGGGDVEDELVPQYFVKVKDLFAMGVQERQKFRRSLSKGIGLDEDSDLRVETNLARFDEVMTKDENILKASVIDENRPPDSPERKSEADVLEIFVRINRQGMPLSRSDLIFSMLKLNWKESAEALPQFVQRINEGNSFRLDTDFVIRCVFAVCDLGTRFDLDLLRTKSNVVLMQTRFQRCCDAIASTLDFVTRECWCQSSTVLGGSATLIPLVYYMFHLPKHQVPNGQISNVRKATYLFGFTQPFSRYADSRLGAFLRQALQPRVAAGDAVFPLEDATYWIRRWERVAGPGVELLQGNATLALHLVQQLTGAKVQYKNNAPELDHIFPRAVLREKGYSELEIENFANFWILPKGKNQNKSDKHPKEYLKDVSDSDLKRALIDREMLDYRRYGAFIEERSTAIVNAVQNKLDLSTADFWQEQSESNS
jgi:hypothetical protein